MKLSVALKTYHYEANQGINRVSPKLSSTVVLFCAGRTACIGLV